MTVYYTMLRRLLILTAFMVGQVMASMYSHYPFTRRELQADALDETVATADTQLEPLTIDAGWVQRATAGSDDPRSVDSLAAMFGMHCPEELGATPGPMIDARCSSAYARATCVTHAANFHSLQLCFQGSAGPRAVEKPCVCSHAALF